MDYNKEYVDKIREEYPIGTKVMLLKMDDIQAPPVGTKGVVSYVDDIGTVFVRWGNGSRLGACLSAGDKIRKL